MAPTDDSQTDTSDERKEGDLFASKLELQLAASIVDRLIERSGGREVADGFWDDDSFDSIDDGDEYVDPEFWDPDNETVPEILEINHNIYECQ